MKAMRMSGIASGNRSCTFPMVNDWQVAVYIEVDLREVVPAAINAET